MLDLRLIREKPELVRQGLERRGEAASLDEILRLDERHRQLLHRVETLRAQHKQRSKQLAVLEQKPSSLIGDAPVGRAN